MLVLSCFAKSCLLGDKRCYCEERLVKEQIILDIKACGISYEIAILAYDPVAGYHYRYRVVGTCRTDCPCYLPCLKTVAAGQSQGYVLIACSCAVRNGAELFPDLELELSTPHEPVSYVERSPLICKILGKLHISLCKFGRQHVKLLFVHVVYAAICSLDASAPAEKSEASRHVENEPG